MTGSKREEKHIICPKCGKTMEKEGVVIDGKFYHDKCGGEINKKVKSLGFVEKVKKIFIA